MSKARGFLQLRRGLWEHVRDGRLSVRAALAFIYICSEADTRTGIWKGCAKSLSGELGIPERTGRDVLEKMEHGDYIRRFAAPGRHFCYPILVHKFLITDGEHNGEQLNATESKSPTDLAYFPREQSVERSVQHDGEDSAAQKRKRIEKETEKENTSVGAKSAPLTVPAKNVFTPPTEEQVTTYMIEIGVTDPAYQAGKFVRHHSERNWRLSGGRGSKMRDLEKGCTHVARQHFAVQWRQGSGGHCPEPSTAARRSGGEVWNPTTREALLASGFRCFLLFLASALREKA